MNTANLARLVTVLIAILIICAAASFIFLPSAFAWLLVGISCGFITLTVLQIRRDKAARRRVRNVASS